MREMLIQANVKSFSARGATIRRNINFFRLHVFFLFPNPSERLMEVKQRRQSMQSRWRFTLLIKLKPISDPSERINYSNRTQRGRREKSSRKCQSVDADWAFHCVAFITRCDTIDDAWDLWKTFLPQKCSIIDDDGSMLSTSVSMTQTMLLNYTTLKEKIAKY